MRTIITAFSSILLSLVLLSCNPAQMAVNDLRSLVEETEKEYAEYTAEEWEEAIDEFSRISEEMEKHHYTNEELKEIGRLKGQMYATIAKQSMGEVGNMLKNFGHQLQGGIEGFMETLSE